MIKTFSDFLHSKKCNFVFEDEAAPSIGGESPPSNPDNVTNKHHFDSLQQQFGIGDEALQSALESDPIQVYKVPDYSEQWGFLVVGPCSAVAKKRSDGNFDLTFQLKEKKMMNPKSFIYSYKQGETPTRYQGSIEDQTVVVSNEELQDIMATPYSGMIGGQASPMSGMSPMGGM